MADFIEGACELTDYITEKHGDKIHDKFVETSRKVRGKPRNGPQRTSTSNSQPPQNQSGQGNDNSVPRDSQQRQRRGSEAVSATTSRGAHRHRNSLPSPEREDKNNAYTYRGPREDSLERASHRSARILEDYENEHDDPRRDPYQTLGRAAIPPVAAGAAVYAASNSDRSPKDIGRRRQSTREYTNINKRANMSYGGNGYNDRPRSQPPPNSRYYYDDDEYGSDYDERTGSRYRRGSGRGYRDEGFDKDVENGEPYREYVETERYRGPARGFQSQFRGPEGGYGPASAAGAGALAPYRRSSRTDVSSRRSKSRGRRDSRSRSRSISGSRSRSRGGEAKHKIEEWFDPSPKGIGFGIAGAVVGGLAGKHLGGGQRGEHHQRDMIIGAVVGGLVANAAEKKVREHRHPEEFRHGRQVGYYDDGRARSSVR